ncbi:hypothetical protein QF026_007422 [Streptomyces aurantiacus]|nr:hypothetical protein [Streptomyces aurantiacus]
MTTVTSYDIVISASPGPARPGRPGRVATVTEDA